MNAVNELGRSEFGPCGGCFKISPPPLPTRLRCAYVINAGSGATDSTTPARCPHTSACRLSLSVHVRDVVVSLCACVCARHALRERERECV